MTSQVTPTKARDQLISGAFILKFKKIDFKKGCIKN